MFEHRRQPLAAHKVYIVRRLRSLAAAAAILLPSLGLGVVGYHVFGHLHWIDALLNASMILTGMGPLNPMPSVPAKLFSSFYALYSGVAFLTMVATLLVYTNFSTPAWREASMRFCVPPTLLS